MICSQNCKTQQQVASTAHQIARAASLYGVTEIIVYNVESKKEDQSKETDVKRLAGFLRYFVTPSYLRKSVFSNLSDYESAKKLPKLPRVPFLSHNSNGAKYLEGLSVPRKIEKKKGKNKRKRKAMKAEEDLTSYINIGESEYLQLSNGVKIPIHSRVIVDKENKVVVSAAEAYGFGKKTGKLSAEEPIWFPEAFGYNVREVTNFGQVFTECLFPEGYKYTAWVPCSEVEGSPESTKSTQQALDLISLIEEETFLKQGVPSSDPTNPKEDIPVLVVFGNWSELSTVILADQENFAGMVEAESLFDGRVRVSRAARIEDAALTILAKIDGL